MKPLMRTLLPISILAGVIFGITFMTNYTDSSRTDDKPLEKSATSRVPLRFFTLTADPLSPAPYMKFWESNVEIGSKGQFDFWCLNRNDQPVTVSVPSKNCQCTSADIGIVGTDAYQNYQANLITGHFLGSGSLIWNALGVVELGKGTEWKPLSVEKDIANATVPAAKGDNNPQPAIVRLSWVGKPGESSKRTIRAVVMSQLPQTNAQETTLEAHITILPSYSVVVPGSSEGELRFGELTPGSSKSREVIVWSATRPALDLSISLSGAILKDPHFDWTPLEQVSDALQDQMERDYSNAMKKPVRIRSAYKTTITAHEAVEIEENGVKAMHHLEIGPFERRLSFSHGSEVNSISMKGGIRGDIRLNNGTQDVDRVDFGTPFPSNQNKVREVTILAERSGIELEVVPELLNPPFLDVKLINLPPSDGKPAWTLKVSIPAGKLYGSLGSNSVIVLQTKDAAKTKIRIPVVAQAHGGGQSPF